MKTNTKKKYEIENMDKYIKQHKNKEENLYIDNNPLLIPHKSRVAIIGASSSGKTNLLTNILIKGLIPFEKVYCYSRHIEQPVYNMIKDHIEKMDGLLHKHYGLNHETIQAWEDKLDDFISVEDLDPQFKNVVILDDFNVNINKKQQQGINQFFTECRHKNASIYFLGQILIPNIPRAIRQNLSHICLFGFNMTKKQIGVLSMEFGGELQKGEFRRIIGKCNKKYSWLLIDNKQDEPHLKYREGFFGMDLYDRI